MIGGDCLSLAYKISHRDQTRCFQVSTVLAWWRGTLGSGQAPRDKEHEMLLALQPNSC